MLHNIAVKSDTPLPNVEDHNEEELEVEEKNIAPDDQGREGQHQARQNVIESLQVFSCNVLFLIYTYSLDVNLWSITFILACSF